MKLAIKNQANFVFIISVLLFLILGCDAPIYLRGKLLDENGNPVNNAKIVLEQGKFFSSDKIKLAEEESKDNGKFQIRSNLCTAPLCSGTMKLNISKEGFQSYEKLFSQKEFQSGEMNITLKIN